MFTRREVSGERVRVEPSPSADTERHRNQDLLDEATKDVDQTDDNFAEIRYDVAGVAVKISWQGEPPEDIKKLEGKTESGVTISIVAVRFGQAAMIKAMGRSFAAAREAQEILPERMQPNPKWDGLVVGFTKESRSKIDEARTRTQLEEPAGMPVEVITVAPAVDAGRNDDSSPWFGGGQMRRPQGDGTDKACTTGFAVLKPGGLGRLLAAAHCDTTGSESWFNGSGAELTDSAGDVDVVLRRDITGNGRWVGDAMFIDPNGGTGGQVHGGPWNATSSNSHYHLKVAGGGTPAT